MATFTAKLRRMALPGLENKFSATTIQPPTEAAVQQHPSAVKIRIQDQEAT